MAEPFLGEIRLVSFNFPPTGWASCNGQFLPINQNQALFSLLGTTYGGNGQTTFALPNLQGRAGMHIGNGHTLGERAGEQAHTLSYAELPVHTHAFNASNQPALASADGITPGAGAVLAQGLVALAGNKRAPAQLYGTGPVNRTLAPGTIASVGGGQAHLNMQPFLTINFIIAVIGGVFPSQS